MQNNIDLGTTPLKRLMPQLALPAITAQVVNILYNIVDRMYIGHISGSGSLALTGLGICLPLLTVISAFSAFAGMGGAPLAAIELGKKDKQKAEAILRNSFFMLLFFSVILTVGISVFKETLLLMFGASQATLPYANEYLTIYLYGTIFVQLAIGLNTFISAQGKAKTAMFSVLIGAVLNLILDPIFIFTFKLGIKGAAIATIISQAVSAVWVLSFLLSKRAVLNLSFKVEKSVRLFSIKTVGKIASLGISPFIMQSTESAIFIVFNTQLQKYGGDLYIGAMTVMQSVMQLALVPIQGFATGVQPIISFNYGAQDFTRIKKTVKAMLIVSMTSAVTFALLITLFPGFFALIFTSETDLIDLIKNLLPLYIGGMWVFGIQMTAQSTFIGLGKAKTSLFVALLRKVILLIPLAYILPLFLGITGIYASEPIASTTSAMTSGVLLLFCIKELNKKGQK